MIIVSQNKVSVLNLDKVNLIGINGDGEVKARLGINDIAVLGIYKTEERAKEVLQEIYKVYSDFTLIKYVNEEYKKKLIIGNRNKYFDVYEMPQE